MEWTLLRGTECMRFENHYDAHTGELVLHIDPPNSDRQTQRFATARAYRSWLAALERQLEADHWTPSGDVRDADTSVNASGATIEKTYKSGTRTFDLQLSRCLIEGQVGWTVTDVIERSRVRTRVTIPAVASIASADRDEAFARACDCIDKWIWVSSGPSHQGR